MVHGVLRGDLSVSVGTRESWAGTTLDARQAKRRGQLIAAAYELLGKQGADAVTVRGVVREAGLSERYFYESFEKRDALLLAVHNRVAEQARAAISKAVEQFVAESADGEIDPRALARTGLSAFTDFLEGDPRRGRVLLQEAFADQVLVRHGVELLPSFAALLIEQIGANFPETDETDQRVSGVALVGALAHLYLAWIDGTLAVSRDRLIDHAVQLILLAAGIHSDGRRA